MKKWKKFAAVILSLAMVLGMTITSAAKENQKASITIEGLSGTATEIRIYQMISVDENANQWVIADWAKDYVSQDQSGAYQYNLKDVKVPDKSSGSMTTSEKTVYFNGLELGAYLITAVDTTGETVYNNAVAVTYEYNEETHLMQGKDAKVIAKSSTSKTKKQQSENVGVSDDAVVEVGSVISYSISTVVPYFDGVDATFWMSDTLTGASYNNDADVFIGNQVVIPNEALKVAEGKTEAEPFRYDLSSLLTDNRFAGQTVRIEYSATVLGSEKVENVASASNNPAGNVPTTVAYTGTAKVTKFGEEKDPLSGAKFILFREKAGKPEYAVLENGFLKKWTGEVKEATAVTTDKAGEAIVKGLSVGTYYVVETVAPAGYSVSNPRKVAGTKYAGEITIKKMENNGEVVVEGSTNVADTKLIALPFTGGVGTTIFEIIGAVIVLGAVAFLLYRKKKNVAKV